MAMLGVVIKLEVSIKPKTLYTYTFGITGNVVMLSLVKGSMPGEYGSCTVSTCGKFGMLDNNCTCTSLLFTSLNVISNSRNPTSPAM